MAAMTLKQQAACSAMCPVTVRFSADAWDAIRETAIENNMSMAELIRIAVAGNLGRYLGDIRIINEEQAAEIKRLIVSYLDTVSRVEIELRRIGVNFNQEIRLKQIERKYRGATSLHSRMKKQEEEKAIIDGSGILSKEELDALITRYEQATKQVGDLLCRILV